jgi:thiopeptide-type bacteriocin biosynthesis protein
MGNIISDDESLQQNWLYLKLYFGNAAERMEHGIIDLCKKLKAETIFKKWFYLRYFDESGIHLRVRVLPQDLGSENEARDIFDSICGDVIYCLHEYPKSNYIPMIQPNNFDIENEIQNVGSNDVYAEFAEYEPELEKFGGDFGVSIAETHFHESSQLASAILDIESQDKGSRKTISPWLMTICYEVFNPTDAKAYWQHYSYFWLGGESHAANDWRERFFDKAESIAELNLHPCTNKENLTDSENEILDSWRNSLEGIKNSYLFAEGKHTAKSDVICFNFSHLLLNRIGITAMEEAYMATLMEYFSQKIELVGSDI